MTAWLRRNRAALLSLIVAIPALVVLLVVVPAAERAPRVATVREVPAGETAEADGLLFTVRVADDFTAEDDGLSLPEGTSIVAAVVDVEATGDAPPPDSCAVTLSQPVGAERRVWNQLDDEAEYGYGRGEGFERFCTPDPTGPYRLELVFLTPSDVIGSATVDVVLAAGGRQQTLRLDLPDGA